MSPAPCCLRGASPYSETPVFLIAAIVATALALILRLASITGGVFLTWQTFTILGLLLFFVHTAVGWWPNRRGA